MCAAHRLAQGRIRPASLRAARGYYDGDGDQEKSSLHGLLGLHYNSFAVEPSPGSPISERAQRDSQHESSDQEPMLYCPVCSRRLTERKCKLFCEQCGYYMSCADYY
jgi:hypothetical protein